MREEHGENAITYFYEQGTHVPLARVDSQNSLTRRQKSTVTPQEVYYYHCNPAGLPEDVTDSAGHIIWRGRYTIWGKLVYEHNTRYTPTGFSQPLRMQGQYNDGNTGLYYNTFHYYDAEAGRYTYKNQMWLA